MRIQRATNGCLLVVLIVGCSASAAIAAESRRRSPFPAAVVVHEELTMHDPRVSLEATCRAPYEVNACTDLTAERFACRCERAEERWFIVAKIELGVVIHLSDVRFLRHEQMHMRQIRESLPRALEGSRPSA